MKSILISIKPRFVAKILNGEKTIEVRKRFPSDYRGWVYIYCTKQNAKYYIQNKIYNSMINGKVVARFYCDKVEDYGNGCLWRNEENSYSDYEKILEPSCLTEDELYAYCNDLCFYAIYISKLEIFDKPKEISEFKTRHYPQFAGMVRNKTHYELRQLTKAPQSWCYIESEN